MAVARPRNQKISYKYQNNKPPSRGAFLFVLREDCRVRCRVFMLFHRDNWNDARAEMGLLRLFIFPIARPVKGGTPLI